jgi:hypothetical protein
MLMSAHRLCPHQEAVVPQGEEGTCGNAFVRDSFSMTNTTQTQVFVERSYTPPVSSLAGVVLVERAFLKKASFAPPQLDTK